MSLAKTKEGELLVGQTSETGEGTREFGGRCAYFMDIWHVADVY